MMGGKDPECRGGFPWDRPAWNSELHAWYRRLTAVRRQTPALRRGEFVPLAQAEGARVYAFARRNEDQVVLVAVNASDETVQLALPVGSLGWANDRAARDLLSETAGVVVGGSLAVQLAPWQTAWLA